MNTPLPFRLTVKAVIIDENRCCLLLRRSTAKHRFVGCWEWPGGKVDAGEDFAEALLREVREEADLTIELTGLAGAMSFDLPHASIVVLCMEARIVSGTVRLSDEHDTHVWAPLAQLDQYPATPGVGEFMVDYARRRLSSLP